MYPYLDGANITRVSGTETQTVITELERHRLLAIVPEQDMAGTLTVYDSLEGAEFATGTATAQDGGTETDSITIGNITITLDDTPTGENQIATEATAGDLTDSLLAALLAHSDYATELWTVAKTDTDELTFTAKTAGQAGNAIPLTETGATWVNSDTTLTGGTNFASGTVKHICAAGLLQSGKEFGLGGVRLVAGLGIERSNAADEVGIVWAPDHAR